MGSTRGWGLIVGVAFALFTWLAPDEWLTPEARYALATISAVVLVVSLLGWMTAFFHERNTEPTTRLLALQDSAQGERQSSTLAMLHDMGAAFSLPSREVQKAEPLDPIFQRLPADIEAARQNGFATTGGSGGLIRMQWREAQYVNVVTHRSQSVIDPRVFLVNVTEHSNGRGDWDINWIELTSGDDTIDRDVGDSPFKFLDISDGFDSIEFAGVTVKWESRFDCAFICYWKNQREPLVTQLSFRWKPGQHPEEL